MSITEWAAVVVGMVVTVAALWSSPTAASVDPADTTVVPAWQNVTIYRPECRAFEEGYWARCERGW
jgi:hypothetical protein